MDDLRERVAAVERALTDGDGDLSALAEGAARAERVADLEATVADLREDVTELEAATQALRGYVGNVRSVNEDVEQRAETAVAAVENVTERVETIESVLGSESGDRAEREVPVAGPSDDASPPAGGDRAGSAGPAVEIPTPTDASGEHRSGGSGGSGSDPGFGGDDDHEPAGDRSAQAQHAQSCPACGRGPTSAAADGGRATGRRQTGADLPDPHGASPARETLGGFDPEQTPEQVDLRRPDDGASPTGRTVDRRSEGDRDLSSGRAGAGASTSGGDQSGLLARARELL